MLEWVSGGPTEMQKNKAVPNVCKLTSKRDKVIGDRKMRILSRFLMRKTNLMLEVQRKMKGLERSI